MPLPYEQPFRQRQRPGILGYVPNSGGYGYRHPGPLNGADRNLIRSSLEAGGIRDPNDQSPSYAPIPRSSQSSGGIVPGNWLNPEVYGPHANEPWFRSGRLSPPTPEGDRARAYQAQNQGLLGAGAGGMRPIATPYSGMPKTPATDEAGRPLSAAGPGHYTKPWDIMNKANADRYRGIISEEEYNQAKLQWDEYKRSKGIADPAQSSAAPSGTLDVPRNANGVAQGFEPEPAMNQGAYPTTYGRFSEADGITPDVLRKNIQGQSTDYWGNVLRPATPTLESGPYGAMPLQRQGGQLTNYGAGQLNQASRNYLGDQNYMPRTTVGGAYGQHPDYDAMAAEAERDAAHNLSQGPGAGPTRLMAAASRRGILGAIPHSSYGATSGMVIDSTGRPRPGWVDNYAGNTGAVGQEDVQRGLAAVYNQGGRTISPSGQMRLSPGSQQYDATQRAGEVFDARRGGLEARVADYEARTAGGGNRARRLANYEMKRGRQQEDMQQRQMAYLMQTNPRLAVQMMGLQQQGQYQQGMLGVQREGLQARERIAGAGLSSQEKIAGMQGENRLGLAQLAGQNAMGLAGLQGQTQKDVAGLLGQNQMGLAGLQATTQKEIAGIQGKNQIGAIEAARDPMAQSKFNIEAIRGLAEVAKTNPALAREMAAQVPGLLGGAGGAAGGGQAGQTGGLLNALNPPGAHLGGLVNESQYAELKNGMGDPQWVEGKLKSFGLKDWDINLALNRLYAPDTIMPWYRQTGHPSGLLTTPGFVNPKTGQPGYDPLIFGNSLTPKAKRQ